MVTEHAATDAGRVRQRNLAAVLQLVHRGAGPGGVAPTRADLTRTLGLNRSTIGDLVAALASAQWVDEVDDAPREGVGRPSPRVVPRSDRLVAAINPELDAIDVALVALGGRVVARRRMPIDVPTVDQTVRFAARVVSELAAEHPESHVVGVGIAVPGLVRRSDGVVRLAPHLGWREQPITAPFSAALGVPAWAANDAQLGCRAEIAFGAGIGARHLVYLNGGASGIGGGIVVDGRLVDGRDGHAGELGHLGIDPQGRECACGARGCLEAMVDRARLVEALALEHPDDDEFTAAIETSTSPIVADLIRRQWVSLRHGVCGIATMLNPERIVLGGYLATLWNLASDDDRAQALADVLPAIGTGVSIEPAALGAHRLLIGAAELAWEPLLANPLS